MMYQVNNNELYHHGILGMRWGIRRFQSYSVTGPRKSGKEGKEIGAAARSGNNSSAPSLSTSQRKAKIKAIRKETAKREKAEYAVQKKEERAEQRRVKTRAEFEKEKHMVLTSGNYQEILNFNDKHRGEITTNELREAINRINAENDLKKMAPRVKTGKEKLKDLSDILNSTANIGESVMRLGKVGTSIYKSLKIRSDKLAYSRTKGDNEKEEKKQHD